MIEPAASATRIVPIPAGRLSEDWSGARRRALAYLEALGIEPQRRGPLADAALERAACRDPSSARGALGDTLDALRDELAGVSDPRAFGGWLLEQAGAGELRGPDKRLASAPPLLRGPMKRQRLESREPRPQRARAAWRRASLRRRWLLALLVLVPSAIAASAVRSVIPETGRVPLEPLLVGFFAVLFGWISIGFWTAVAGFLVLLTGRDRHAPRAAPGFPGAVEPVRTAIAMPICEEPVERCFAGLQALERSLERLPGGHPGMTFDLFVLSDTADPGRQIDEEEAWFEWWRRSRRAFYRRRRVRLARKAGNIADFLRRWGRRYEYLVVLDADSVMSGAAVVELVRRMHANPEVGILQTAPASFGRRTAFARLQQFASAVYGPLFNAGLHFWQLGQGAYWGHNAILRTRAFMAACGLPHLPGKPPLGGEILSHDFVEAALMGRAGFSIWLAYDLAGSWEEPTASLLEEMKRDRRWCQGNLQHLKLLHAEYFSSAHRALFVSGALSYGSALLWFAFLCASTMEAVCDVFVEPDYFPAGRSLFPQWPVWHVEWALWLLAATGVLLFAPKLLAALHVVFSNARARSFGGAGRLLLGVALETAAAALFAPVRMAFHTRFVLATLARRTTGWRSPVRADDETRWSDALRYHGFDTLVGCAWGGAIYALNPTYFWWLLPVVGALALSIPLSVFSSRVRVGDAFARLGIWLTPVDLDPPQELRDLDELSQPRERGDGFTRAVVVPLTQALHSALAAQSRPGIERIRTARRELALRALEEGPAALTAPQRRRLLRDPAALTELHDAVWCLPDAPRARRWGLAGA
jgi:membrane glycosyltransferase